LPEITDDAIYQVSLRGEIVWNFVASEHLEEFGFTPQELRLVKATKNPDYLHINAMTPLGPNKWFTQGDQRFDPQNILISSRNSNIVALVRKEDRPHGVETRSGRPRAIPAKASAARRSGRGTA
jgi:hypothetical protein